MTNQQQQNIHFHDKEKGCDIIPHIIKPKYRSGYKIQGSYCKTHDIEACKCGWEFSWHGGSYIKELK